VQALKSIRDLSKDRNSLGLQLGHKWRMHFGCANGFLGLCHTLLGRGFIFKHGAYWQSSSLKRHPSCFGHFVFMCSSLTFLSHKNNTSFFFLPVSFGRFQQENYAGMWGHYESKIVGVFSRPFSKESISSTNILWWYTPFLYKGVCPICFLRELGFCGSIFVL
jgi:hypothetical protein